MSGFPLAIRWINKTLYRSAPGLAHFVAHELKIWPTPDRECYPKMNISPWHSLRSAGVSEQLQSSQRKHSPPCSSSTCWSLNKVKPRWTRGNSQHFSSRRTSKFVRILDLFLGSPQLDIILKLVIAVCVCV